MDDIDLANQHADMLRDAYVKVRKPEGPLATGSCLWCEKPQEDPTRRWCDADCRDTMELQQKNRQHRD